MKRFYSMNTERRLRLFVAVVIVPAGAVCAFMHLRDGMFFALVAPFFLIFLLPESMAFAADSLIRFKQVKACNAICNFGLAYFPASEGLLTAKSLMLYQAKRFEEAECELTKVLSLNPISVQNLIDRSAARCYLAKFEDAEVDANLAIGLAPRWHDAYLTRACARLGQQNYEGCLEDTKLLQQFGKHVPAARFSAVSCYLMTGRMGEAEAVTSGLIGKVKNGTFDALSLVYVHFNRNDFAEVLEACAQVTDQEPLAYEFISMQAASYFMLSEGALAMELTARAIALQPSAEDSHLLRAFVLADAGRLDEATSECARIRAGSVSTSMTRDAQAFIFWRQEQWRKMLEASDQAIERCPTSTSSHALRSLALSGLERFEEALDAGQKATTLQPWLAFGWYSLANGYLKSGQVSEALNCLNTALTNDPHNRYSYQLRAQVHLQAGDEIQAAKDQAKYDELQAKFVANWQPVLA
jgi:tetratricopeptide (TPR) repeat protein